MNRAVNERTGPARAAFPALARSCLTLALAACLCLPAQAEDCTPEGVEASMTEAALPAGFPTSIPLPQDYFLMSASETGADEYNPYPNVTLELLAEGGRQDLFGFYERALPAAGYRIVMWENDEGATGLRVRGDGIDQATISMNDYDCRAYVMINVSLLP